MRRTFNRFLPSAFIVTLSLGAARVGVFRWPQRYAANADRDADARRGAKRAVVGRTR